MAKKPEQKLRYCPGVSAMFLWRSCFAGVWRSMLHERSEQGRNKAVGFLKPNAKL